MGTYVAYVCHQKKQWIDPGDINDGAIKAQHVGERNDLGKIVLFLLSYRAKNLKWPSISEVTDSTSEYDCTLRYHNITSDVVRAYNETKAEEEEALEFTGESLEWFGEEFEAPEPIGDLEDSEGLEESEPMARPPMIGRKKCIHCSALVGIEFRENGSFELDCGHHESV